MWIILGMVYIVGGIFCSIIVIASCVVHGRAARNAPTVPSTQARNGFTPTERTAAAPKATQDADNQLVIHPA